MTLLSIIIPTYNAEKHISKVLHSIIQQDFTNYEVIILDNCSTDNTVDIVQRIKNEYLQIKIICDKDEGIYDAMSKGLDIAAGEWVYFIGSDDFLADKYVLSQVSTFLTSKIDLVYGDILWIPDEVVESGECNASLLISRNINHQRIFYRKDLFKKYGGYDLQYHIASDYELNIRFFCNDAIRKQYVPVRIAHYYSGGFSANKVDEVFWANWKKIFKANFSIHLSNKLMYQRLGWYCHSLIDRHEYRKALPLFFDVFCHTLSPGFVKLTMEQYFKSRKLYAG